MAIEKNQRIKAEDVRQGLTIWDPSLEYQINATCYYVNDDEGIPYTIYRNITGNNTSTNPSEDTTNWEALKLGGSGGANLPMFYNHRFSWKPQDVSWVNSENYSWLYKTPYIGAYDHLVKRYQPTGKFREGNTYYVIIFSDGDIQTTNVTVASGTVSNLQTWATEKGYTTTGSSIEDLIVSKTLTAETETIAGITITFYRCYDKKKIVLPTEVTNVNAIYAATGIAEYFILDTENLRFKLPRNKWGYYGTGSGDLGDYVPESVPNIKGSLNILRETPNTIATGSLYIDDTQASSDNRRIDSITTSSNKGLHLDASRSSSAYQDNAPVQPRGAKGDLYFYLGSADLDEIVSISFDVLNSKANVELNNLTAKGKNIANWSSNVTNCITEIPQDIKLELNNGVLTLKAGSKVYVPNGFESDGKTPKFDELVFPSDYAISGLGTGTYKKVLVVKSGDRFAVTQDNCYSSSSAPTGVKYSIWYDTSSNKIKVSNDSGVTWLDGWSFPICIVSHTPDVITSIDQVFNGFGYIGKRNFITNAKFSIAKGYNADGTCHSQEYTITSPIVSINDFYADSTMFFRNNGGAYQIYNISNQHYLGELAYVPAVGTTFQWYYNTTTRMWYMHEAGEQAWRQVDYANLGINTSIETKFKEVFHAIDYNDKSTIVGWGMPDYTAVVKTSSLPELYADKNYYVKIQSASANGFDLYKGDTLIMTEVILSSNYVSSSCIVPKGYTIKFRNGDRNYNLWYCPLIS